MEKNQIMQDHAENLKSVNTTRPHIRESNFELLRIIAMFMVLVLHADFQALGAPTREDIISSPIVSSLKVFFEMSSIVAVNVFILISGWFGIRPSIKGFCKFVFQCLFFSIGIYLVMILLGRAELSLRGLAACFALLPGGSYWFIPSYIGLYLFSPVLNSFIKSADKKTFLYVLVGFYTFQTVYAFLGGGANYLMKGYSALSFMGLYLLAAYIRMHVDLKKYIRKVFLASYFVLTVGLTLLWIFFEYVDFGPLSSRLLNYSNPIVVLSSSFLLMYFSRIKCSSVLVNKIAASCFAVYLLHCNPNVWEFYLDTFRRIEVSNGFMHFLICIAGMLCIWFVLSIVLDQLRAVLWDSVIRIKDYYIKL